MRFHAPLRIGDRVRLESELKALERKRGRTGELIVATVANRLLGDGGELAVEEEHDIVAREAVAAGAANPMPAAQAAPGDAPWRDSIALDAVMLFRFSALVFNAHRIHYDRAHATRVEGYRGLVVHGPLHLILLLELLRRHAPGARDRVVGACGCGRRCSTTRRCALAGRPVRRRRRCRAVDRDPGRRRRRRGRGRLRRGPVRETPHAPVARAGAVDAVLHAAFRPARLAGDPHRGDAARRTPTLRATPTAMSAATWPGRTGAATTSRPMSARR